MKRFTTGSIATFTLALLLSACGEIPAAPAQAAADGTDEGRGIVPGQASVLDVTATHRSGEHIFSLSEDEVPQGWTTIRFTNESHSDHFVLLYRAPEEAITSAAAAGRSLRDHWYETITVPFQEEFDPYIRGEIAYGDFVQNLLAELGGAVAWLVPMGGPGLTAVGHSSETTLHLTPGTYVLECYVKDGAGQFHSYRGMLETLTVTAAESGAGEPRESARIVVSQPAEGGLQAPEELRPGMHTFAIEFGEQPAYGYEHLLGHNAHLVRLDDGADQTLLTELAAWMDWTQPGGLAAVAPRGAAFLGGSMEMAGGSTAYFTVNLTPGDYAWIAEVPDPAAKKMLTTFTVPGAGAGNR